MPHTLLASALVSLAITVATPATASAQSAPPPIPHAIATHDNVTPAGAVENGELRLSLWAGMGTWLPAGAGSGITVAAFGEEGGPLSIPSPLVRATQGTIVRASIRNALPAPLRVTGFCDRPGACAPLVIAPGSTEEVRFSLGSAGTFHYWGTTSTGLGNREGSDSQLGGAIVSDPDGARVPDRVFVMGRKAADAGPEGTLTVINGRSWPHTERLAYGTGDTVRWRVVNLTNIAHAMHLHGFYFTVDSVGNGVADDRYAEAARRLAVTEQVPSGATMSLTWVPERPGNWLFHCHMLAHMMTRGALHPAPDTAHAVHAPQPGDPAAGMAGLVLGVLVTGPSRAAAPSHPPRQLQMVLDHDTRFGDAPSYKIDLSSAGAAAPRLNDHAAPGPIMVLTRGEPVAVEIVNQLREATAIHWHGIELESYDDGVPGFGGTSGSITPPVLPGGTFTARFTPARAGTFIYHTHWHNPGQLAGGIYGPIVVLEPGETYEPGRDHLIVVGLEGAYPDDPLRNEPFAVNGERKPRELVLQRDVTNRLRFINITADAVALTVQLTSRFDPVQWTLVGKDGAATPAAQRTLRSSRQLVSVGETYDFELTPPTRGPLWLEVRRGNGEQLLQWAVVVR
ncbi:MAG: multicopper oxidase domain-containing protein [Acidobacteriota bacterium]|nr:multicopper oxidase domain-containing protein [Acidobacteriota bacterium]